MEYMSFNMSTITFYFTCVCSLNCRQWSWRRPWWTNYVTINSLINRIVYCSYVFSRLEIKEHRYSLQNYQTTHFPSKYFPSLLCRRVFVLRTMHSEHVVFKWQVIWYKMIIKIFYLCDFYFTKKICWMDYLTVEKWLISKNNTFISRGLSASISVLGIRPVKVKFISSIWGCQRNKSVVINLKHWY